jgi:hypothetical protein
MAKYSGFKQKQNQKQKQNKTNGYWPDKRDNKLLF